MNKSIKILTAGLLSTALVMPIVSFAETTTKNDSNININLEKRTILLGDKSNINISFKEKPNANSITLNYLCYDMPLSTILDYNEQTDTYEGEINFNQDPEYLNVWEIENIVINNEENPQTLSKENLEELGLNLSDYNVTQEYIVPHVRNISTYMQKSGAPVKKLVGNRREDTSVEISKEGWKNGSDKVIIVNGSAISDGITATPLATTYDAPILLAYKDEVPESIKKEIIRLNPSEIIVVGGDAVISESVMDDLDKVNNASVRRLYGINRYETSLKIAQEINKDHDINKIYIANGYEGEVDALTIAAKAGQDEQPIILSKKEEIPQDSYDWLKNQDLRDAYFIGGETVLATSVIHQVAGITTPASGQSVYKNRVYGKNRHETNANVIKRFYPQNELNAVLVAKSDVLVDALAAGPLAAKLNAPILINPTSAVSSDHDENLSNKSAEVVYQVGGGIKDSVINEIAYRLSKYTTEGKTVVIDAGHGGSDPGKVHKGTNEKQYTLDVSLATSEYLNNNNVNVVMTRDSDVTMALKARTDLGNKINPDLFASIHFNAYNESASGVEVFHQVADKNGGYTKTAATNVINRILEKFNFKNRGPKTSTLDNGKDYLHILRESNGPAILIECAFMDSPTDIPQINDLSERKLLGVQIGKGIEETVKK